MFRPTAADLPDLQGQDTAFFGQWLEDGLRGILQRGMSGRAFVGEASSFIGWSESLSDELAAVHDALAQPITQRAFKAGCAMALSNMRLSTALDCQIAHELLVLGAKIHARQVLRVLASLSHQWFGPHEGVDLLNVAFDVAGDLARPDLAAEGLPPFEGELAILHLTRAPGFRAEQATQALLALCAVSPQRFDEHLSALYRILTETFGFLNNKDDEAKRRVHRINLISRVSSRVFDDDALLRSLVLGGRPTSGMRLRHIDLLQDWWTRTITEDDDPLVRRIWVDRLAPRMYSAPSEFEPVRPRRMQPAYDVKLVHMGCFEIDASWLGSEGLVEMSEADLYCEAQ